VAELVATANAGRDGGSEIEPGYRDRDGEASREAPWQRWWATHRRLGNYGCVHWPTRARHTSWCSAARQDAGVVMSHEERGWGSFRSCLDDKTSSAKGDGSRSRFPGKLFCFKANSSCNVVGSVQR
jgi:hypothetical protein